MGIIKLICDRKEERVRQGRKVTAVDGRYFKLAENLLYGERKWHWIKTQRKSTGLFRSSVGNPII